MLRGGFELLRAAAAGLGPEDVAHDADGFVRLIFDKDTELLLGGEIVGPEASNLIAELGLGLEMGALASDLGLTIHAHPTLSETIMEAANASLGHAIHALAKR